MVGCLVLSKVVEETEFRTTLEEELQRHRTLQMIRWLLAHFSEEIRTFAEFIHDNIWYNPLPRETLQLLAQQHLWTSFWPPNAFHGVFWIVALWSGLTVDIYVYMDSLFPNPLQSPVPTGQNTPIAVLRSGNQTPALVAKVLRWKDFDAAVMTRQENRRNPDSDYAPDRGMNTRLGNDTGWRYSDIEDFFMWPNSNEVILQVDISGSMVRYISISKISISLEIFPCIQM